VKFHDGEPFDAEAAKFSLDRHVTMADLVPQAGTGPARTMFDVVDPSPSNWS